MTDHPDELGHYLEGRSKLSSAYRELGSEAPSARIDEAVLAASRERFAARRAPGRRLLPLAAAAVIVLGVGLVLRIATEPSVPQAERDGFDAFSTAQETPAQETPRLPADARREKARALEAAMSAKTTTGDRGAEACAESRAADEGETPQQRLAFVLCLHESGAEATAQRELASFREAWPDHPLPETLRDW